MKQLTALVTLFACACATIRTPDPVIPAVVEPAHAQELYEAYKLVCKEQSCEQNGETNPVRSYERTRLDMPREVLTASRRARNGVSWVFFGTSIASALGSGLSFIYAYDGLHEHDEWRKAGIGLAGGAVGSLLVGLLIRAVWPDPTEKFETAYNRALKIELERRVAGDPTALGALQELTAAQKECVRQRSRPGTMFFSNLKISGCFPKR